MVANIGNGFIVLPDSSKYDRMKTGAEANGKIDAEFHQGQIGDCALLSSFFSISQTEEGAELIEEALHINKDANGNITSYDVTFGGNGETYTITQQELNDAKSYNIIADREKNVAHMDKNSRLYSYGDDDMTIFELAFEKAFETSKDPILRALVDGYSNGINAEDKLEGVNPASVSYLIQGGTSNWLTVRGTKLPETTMPGEDLTPDHDTQAKDFYGNDVVFKEGHYYTRKGEMKEDANGYQYVEVYDVTKPNEKIVMSAVDYTAVLNANIDNNAQEVKELFDNFSKNKDAQMLVFATNGGTLTADGRETASQSVKGINGEDVVLYAPHAYSVADVAGDVVTLINPHNTGEPLKVSLKSLLSLPEFTAYALDLPKIEEMEAQAA